jgi:hypothetical protein
MIYKIKKWLSEHENLIFEDTWEKRFKKIIIFWIKQKCSRINRET